MLDLSSLCCKQTIAKDRRVLIIRITLECLLHGTVSRRLLSILSLRRIVPVLLRRLVGHGALPAGKPARRRDDASISISSRHVGDRSVLGQCQRVARRRPSGHWLRLAVLVIEIDEASHAVGSGGLFQKTETLLKRGNGAKATQRQGLQREQKRARASKTTSTGCDLA